MKMGYRHFWRKGAAIICIFALIMSMAFGLAEESDANGSPQDSASNEQSNALASEQSSVSGNDEPEKTPPEGEKDNPNDEPNPSICDNSDGEGETNDNPGDAPDTESDSGGGVSLNTLFKIRIKVPDGWTNTPSKSVRIVITPLSSVTEWASVQYMLGSTYWLTITEPFSVMEGIYYTDVDVTENAVMTVRLYANDGSFVEARQEISVFDRIPPTVTAGFDDHLLRVEAPDDLSGAAGVQVNGLLFTTLENGMLNVRMEDTLLTYKQLAIRAYDYVGNFSDPVTLDNPYYTAPTATPKATVKPTATPRPTTKPTVKPTAAPTVKPTSSTPSSGGVTTITTAPTAVATALPTIEPGLTAFPAVTATQAPVIIYITQEPTVTPEPVTETVYVPIGPGQPYKSDGNMQTLDVLYSAATNKQFITVQSRSGETYFLVIDYDKPIDEENEIYETYFLNMVDDRDLMAVLSDEEKETVPTPTPQIVYVTPEPTTMPTAAPVTDTGVKSSGGNTGTLLLFLLLLAGGGVAVWYFVKQKNDAPGRRSLDESGFEEDDADSEDELE